MEDVLRRLYEQVAKDPLLQGVGSDPLDSVGSPQYEIPNPQSRVCHKILGYTESLHKAREVAHDHLQVDNLGFYDVEALMDLLPGEVANSISDLSELVVQPYPEVSIYPQAPPLDIVFERKHGSKIINFGSGGEDSYEPGTISYDPLHVHRRIDGLSASAKVIDEEGWEQAKMSGNASVVSRNAIMHTDNVEDLQCVVGAHITPNYPRWEAAGMATKEGNHYTVGELVAAQGDGGNRERDWAPSADAVVNLGMFLVLYFFKGIVIDFKKVAESPKVVLGLFRSLAQPGNSVTVKTETEFSYKIDGILRHLLIANGFATLYTTNRKVIGCWSVGSVLLSGRLMFEQVENQLYLLGGEWCGVRLPQLQSVLQAFLRKVTLRIPNYEVRNKPPFGNNLGVPVDGLVGANFSRQHVHYYKSQSRIEVDMRYGDILRENSPLLRAAGRAKMDLDLEGVTNFKSDDDAVVLLTFTQLIVRVGEKETTVPCFKLTAIESRPDKTMNDSEEKILDLLLQPRAEDIAEQQGFIYEGEPPLVIDLD